MRGERCLVCRRRRLSCVCAPAELTPEMARVEEHYQRALAAIAKLQGRDSGSPREAAREEPNTRKGKIGEGSSVTSSHREDSEPRAAVNGGEE